MIADPEVSVVLAARDSSAEATLGAKSILAQAGIALELIAVDDGSTDGTEKELAALAARDSRVRVVRQPAAGLTAALARGCAEARAPLIARQDAGDLSHPARLARQVAFLGDHPRVVLLSSWTACVGPAGEPLYIERQGGDPGVELEIGTGATGEPTIGPTSHGSVVFRREAYGAAGGYRPEFALGQDWDLWYRLARLGKFALLGETLYLRRLLPRSLTFAAHDLQVEYKRLARESAQRRARGMDDREVLAEAARFAARFARERHERLVRGEALGCYHLGSLLRRLGDRRAAGYLAAAWRRRPWFARAWVRWAQAILTAARRSAPDGFDSPEARWLLAAHQPGSGDAA